MNDKYRDLKCEIVNHQNSLKGSRCQQEVLLNERFENDKLVLEKSGALELIKELISDGILKYSNDSPAQISDYTDLQYWTNHHELSIWCYFDVRTPINGDRYCSGFRITVREGKMFIKSGGIESVNPIEEGRTDVAIINAIKKPFTKDLE